MNFKVIYFLYINNCTFLPFNLKILNLYNDRAKN